MILRAITQLVSATVAVAMTAAVTGCAAPAPSAAPGVPGTTRPAQVTVVVGATFEPSYDASVRAIGPALRERMRRSHHVGCPVRLAELRYLRVPYRGLDGRPHLGELVVHQSLARDAVRVFAELYDADWPIDQMRLVDDFGGDDDRSMAADNTSAYNCRRVSGTDHWSAHAFGAAIDLNPVRNPMVTGTRVAPPEGRRFASLDREGGAVLPLGVIRSGDVVVEAFARIGWEWGGDWTWPKDYQHFEAVRP